jgi:cell division protein FtsN
MADLLRVTKQISYQIFSLMLILLITNCSNWHNSNSSKITDNTKPKIRIVDLNGHPHKVVTRVPTLNAQIMSRSSENNASYVANQNPSQNSLTPSNDNLLAPIYNTQPSNDEQFSDNKYTNNNPAFIQSSEVVANNYALPITSNEQVNQSADLTNFVNPEIKNNFQQNLPLNSENLAQIAKQNNDSLPSRYYGTNDQSTTAIISDTKPIKNFKLTNHNSSALFSDPLISVSKEKGIFVQVGSFSVIDNAKYSLSQLSSFNKGQIEEINIGNKKSYRVLLGPFSDKKQANKMVKTLLQSGHKAFLVRNK